MLPPSLPKKMMLKVQENAIESVTVSFNEPVGLTPMLGVFSYFNMPPSTL